MMKIYNINNEVRKCKNLTEVERALFDYYNNDTIKVYNFEGMEHLDIFNTYYKNDYYGNPLYMVIIYNTKTRQRHIFKSQQSYNIVDTMKYLANNL